MDVDMAQFRTEILDPFDKEIECETCKFIESGLIRWKKPGAKAIRVSCRECHVYEDPLRYQGQFKMLFENEMTSISIANMSRMVAIYVHTGFWYKEISLVVKASMQTQEIPAIAGLKLDGNHLKNLGDALAVWLDVLADDAIETIEESLLAKFETRTQKIGEMLSQVIQKDKNAIVNDWDDVEAARQLMAPDEAKIFDWSVRYIPVSFDPLRVKGWINLKQKFFEELSFIASRANLRNPPKKEAPQKDTPLQVEPFERGRSSSQEDSTTSDFFDGFHDMPSDTAQGGKE